MGAFNREFVKTGVFPPDTSRRIQRLFEDRATADYDWKIRVNETTASADVTDAEWMVKMCHDHLKKINAL